MLKGLKYPFTILVNYKNLEQFTRKQKLSERQYRWSETLAKYRYDLVWRKGIEAVVLDALLRRE